MKRGANVKWLLAGAGDIANRRVADALSRAENSELVAVCDPVTEKAVSLARRMNAPEIWSDYEEALVRTEADAVYIAAPAQFHVPMCRKALRAGKHLLCEKPLALNPEECAGLCEDLENSFPGQISSCSNYRLFSSQFRKTRELIGNGSIGTLFGGWAHDEEAVWNPGGHPLLKENGSSPLLQFGFYLIDMARELFGMPEQVFACMHSFNPSGRKQYDVEDLQNVFLRFPGGEQFTILINTTADHLPLRHSCEFFGSSGRIHWPGCPPHFNEPVLLVNSGGTAEVPESVSGEARGVIPNWHLPMIENFVHAVLDSVPVLCSMQNAVRTTCITEAAFRSVKSGKAEKPEDFFS